MSKELVIFTFVLVILIFISLFLGAYPISVRRLFSGTLSGEYPKIYRTVIFEIRLPRVLFCVLVGAGLSVAGASYQSTFKNPLVSPYILGVSSGAAFGASLAILLNLKFYFIQVCSFGFGILATFLVYVLAKKSRNLSLLGLIISGVIISSFFQSLVSLVKCFADTENQLPSIVFWLMGSFSGVNWSNLGSFLVIFAGIVLMCLMRWQLNVISLDDEEVRSLGLNIETIRKTIIVISTLITASSVCVVGIIGWIGLIIPHISRLIVGSDNLKVIPLSVVLGGLFMLVTDDLARTLTTGEIPIGIITSLVGAPFFAYLYCSKKEQSL